MGKVFGAKTEYLVVFCYLTPGRKQKLEAKENILNFGNERANVDP